MSAPTMDYYSEIICIIRKIHRSRKQLACAIHGFLRNVRIHRLRSATHGSRLAIDCPKHYQMALNESKQRDKHTSTRRSKKCSLYASMENTCTSSRMNQLPLSGRLNDAYPGRARKKYAILHNLENACITYCMKSPSTD